jgi:alpha-1,3-mannosyltransferase
MAKQSAPSASVHPVVKRLQQLSKPCYDGTFITLLLLGEVILSAAIIHFVSYTEIDWVAYMEEVEGWWVDGICDYRQLRGGTGPLVYPAGFLYTFAVLRYITELGTNVLRAQYIFGAFYLVQLLLVLKVFTNVLRCRSRDWKSVWSWRIAMALLCLSKRIHSIFVLRLFNDGLAMLFLYLSVYLFAKNTWKWGCLWFSMAVSIKMNVLLFAPGLLLLLLQTHATYVGTLLCLSICASVQLLLGAPFLLSYPESYLRKAFEIDRVFFYKWTVNWKVRLICDISRKRICRYQYLKFSIVFFSFLKRKHLYQNHFRSYC